MASGDSVLLEVTGVDEVHQLGHDERLGGRHRARLGNGADRGEYGLQEGGGRPLLFLGGIGLGRRLGSVPGGRPHRALPRSSGGFSGALSLSSSSFGFAFSRSVLFGNRGLFGGSFCRFLDDLLSSAVAVLDVDVDTDDSNVSGGGLPHHMHLHSVTNSGIEVFAREMEVELLEAELDVVEGHGPALGNHLDRRPEVLELGSFGEVWDCDAEIGRRDERELAFDHVDGRLVASGGTEDVGRVEGDPVQRALGTVDLSKLSTCRRVLEEDFFLSIRTVRAE